MTPIFPGRFTADTDDPFIVFLIGMRINKPLALSRWVPTAMAMGPMLKSLYQNPESGFLGGEVILYRGGIGLIQYWRSAEDLERFARTPSEPHLKAWQRFNKAVGKDGSVGNLRSRGGRLRSHLRQHAEVRPRGGHSPRPGRKARRNRAGAAGRRLT